MNANVSRLLNEQINKEFYSAYLYLDFANYYAADLITKMELFGGDSKGLYMLNSELKARVYTAPSLVL